MRNLIEKGKCFLGIEFGSTRIKGILIDEAGRTLAKGIHDWENSYENGFWTYSETCIVKGLQSCYKDLKESLSLQNITLKKLAGLGISGMMHGYLPFCGDTLLTPFRTWRNNTTEESASELTELFGFNIPNRWSIAHLDQAILKVEDHVKKITHFTTLAGFVHNLLCGEKVLGIGEASGMFPIDSKILDYNQEMLASYQKRLDSKGVNLKIKEILPKVLVAGENAGTLSEKGARLLDPSGDLEAGAIMCPPEGDAGTGMVATNSIKKRTGNASLGTSAFAMVVLEESLKKLHRELDMVTTPSGAAVAMAHSNNCTTALNSWISLFSETLSAFGVTPKTGEIYETLFKKSLEGDPSCGRLMSYCFHSGEHAVGLSDGCPMFVHPAGSAFNLANFMKSQIYTSIAGMRLGLDILLKEEKVSLDKILGHGGIFATKGVASQVLADATGVPVQVLETATEGGAWGIAVLALYVSVAKNFSLDDFLDNVIFTNAQVATTLPTKEGVKGYEEFMTTFKKLLPAEVQLVKSLKS